MPKPNFKGGNGRTPKPSKEENVTNVSSPLEIALLPGLEGAGRLATTQRAGQFLSQDVEFGEARKADISQAMICTLGWMPCIGDLKGEGKSIVYTSYFEFYKYIRAHNASVANYDAIDVFKSMIAADGIIIQASYIAYLIKVLQTPGSHLSSVFPQVLMASLNLTEDDRKKLNEYRTRYNQLISLADGLMLPKNVKMFARHGMITGNLWVDDKDIAKSQYYQFVPQYFYRLINDPSDPDVGQLKVVHTHNSSITAMLDFLGELINDYTTDADMNYILAEVMKAFSPSDMITLNPIASTDIIPIAFDQTILDQIKNATLVGDIYSIETWDLIDDMAGHLRYSGSASTLNCLVYQEGEGYLAGQDGLKAKEGKLVLHTHEDQPVENTVATLTQFMATFDTTANMNAALVENMSTEVIFGASFCVATETGFTRYNYARFNAIRYAATREERTYYYNLVKLFQTFSYAPTFYVGLVDIPEAEANAFTNVFYCEADVDNRVTFDTGVLDLLHNSTVATLIQPNI